MRHAILKYYQKNSQFLVICKINLATLRKLNFYIKCVRKANFYSSFGRLALNLYSMSWDFWQLTHLHFEIWYLLPSTKPYEFTSPFSATLCRPFAFILSFLYIFFAFSLQRGKEGNPLSGAVCAMTSSTDYHNTPLHRKNYWIKEPFTLNITILWKVLGFFWKIHNSTPTLYVCALPLTFYVLL